MNIFVFYADNHLLNAQSHDDKTVTKLALECAQILATAASHWGFTVALTSQGQPYKSTHGSHPCTVWLTEAPANYIWAIDYLQSLLDEQERRYGRRSTHLQNACKHYQKQVSEAWPDVFCQPENFAVAINVRYLAIMQDAGIITGEQARELSATKRADARLAELAYQAYLRIAKCHYACWLHSEPPTFWLAEHTEAQELFANGFRRFCRYKQVPVRASAPVSELTQVSAWQAIEAVCGRRQKLKQELMQVLLAEGEESALRKLFIAITR